MISPCTVAGRLAASLLIVSCAPSPHIEDISLDWRPAEEVNRLLPDGIRVFQGVNSQVPLRAWYVWVNEPDECITTRVVVADDADARETGTSFARRLGARVVVNGGYFRMDRGPATHVGLLLVDRSMIQAPTLSVIREETRYPLARAALGLSESGAVDVAWVSQHSGELVQWPLPPPNAPARPVPPLDNSQLKPWRVRDAVSGGPALIHDGKVLVTIEEEVFFGTRIPEVHPRTAAGYTAGGALILLVVDGRQRDSRGVNLVELANLLLDLGSVEALNLDGGGSSTLVVDGSVINRPIGSGMEREVMSALAVFHTPLP